MDKVGPQMSELCHCKFCGILLNPEDVEKHEDICFMNDEGLDDPWEEIDLDLLDEIDY